MKPQTENDADMLNALNAGSHKSFEYFYKKYHTYIFIVANSYLSNEDDAKDARSRAFIKLLDRIGCIKFDSVASLYTWLRNTTKNTCIDYLRFCKIREDRKSDMIKVLSAPYHKDVFEVSDKEAIVLDRIIQQMEMLPPKFRAVFKMRCIDELKFKDISQVLSVDVSTIKKRYTRALELIRRAFTLQINLFFI